MATLTIRDFDDRLRDQLRIRAAQHGRSMEAEVRAILSQALITQSESSGLGSRIHQRFAAVGSIDLDLPDRIEQPRDPDLSS